MKFTKKQIEIAKKESGSKGGKAIRLNRTHIEKAVRNLKDAGK
jgi:biotin operon repressor